MKRLLTGSLLALSLAALPPARAASAASLDDATPARAQKKATKKVSTPAWQSGRSSAPADWSTSDPEAYQRELDAAKEQRDRELDEASKETDRAKFEKRKAEIFARHTAIMAKLSEKYKATQPDGPPPPTWSATKKTE